MPGAKYCVLYQWDRDKSEESWVKFGDLPFFYSRFQRDPRARWRTMAKVEIANRAFQIREDEPTQRVPLKDHKTP